MPAFRNRARKNGGDGLPHQDLVVPFHQVIFQLTDLLVTQLRIEALTLQVKGRDT